MGIATLFRNKGPSSRASCLCQWPRVDTHAHGILLILPASNHFLLGGFPELVHIIVSTSLAKSSGNLYAAKPLATTRDINQAELESLTIIGKKSNLWFGRHIWVLILIWDKSPRNINYQSVWQSLFFAIPMESGYAMAWYNQGRWSTAYFALKSSLRVNTRTLWQWRGTGFGNETLRSSRYRHVEPGSRNAKVRALKVRRGQAGQGAVRGGSKGTFTEYLGVTLCEKVEEKQESMKKRLIGIKVHFLQYSGWWHVRHNKINCHWWPNVQICYLISVLVTFYDLVKLIVNKF